MVKSKARIVGLLTIAIFYCLTLFSKNSTALPHQYNDSNTDNYFSVATTSLYCTTNPTESSLKHQNNLRIPVSYNDDNNHLAPNRATDDATFQAFTQYTFLSHNLLIRFRKSDHLFPFHNFW
jgi:hypothetical protein